MIAVAQATKEKVVVDVGSHRYSSRRAGVEMCYRDVNVTDQLFAPLSLIRTSPTNDINQVSFLKLAHFSALCFNPIRVPAWKAIG